MELPCRVRGDELLPPGAMTDLRRRLRLLAGRHELASVIACSFDHRTRMLPFIFADTRAAPAGVRAIGSAMADAGFARTRIVLGQWNRHFQPSQMRLDGNLPDLFMVSSMQIHTAQCKALIRDACRIEPSRRPLIIAGGPKVIYEPWDVFAFDPAQPWGADLAVTGEEYVLLNLLEVLLNFRAGGESMRSAFARARDAGALNDIPGLVYAHADKSGLAEELVDTGPQRLLGDLDELPHPALGFALLEAPSRKAALASQPLPPDRVGRHSPLGTLVLTAGCRFGCPYCPIPAYNQRQFRSKSGQRIGDEMVRLYNEFGIRYFFGADDNFFNDRKRAVEILETLEGTRLNGGYLRDRARWGTEATVHDTLAMKDHLRTARKTGLRALWMGVEDMTGALVRKGQTPDNTREAFALLRHQGISPMPMLMHHDAQPLYTPGRPAGLLNQVKLLRKAGAIGLQVLMFTPAPGSRTYEDAFASGLVIESAGGRPVQPHMLDGNYVTASRHRQPWRKQLNILAAYLYFYNPVRFLVSLFFPKARLYLVDCGAQVLGMWGLGHTLRRTAGWACRLIAGRIKRYTRPPSSPVPLRRI
jgi:radical SAM superfamily enzyme YgiQ (UPF0313 family)